MSHSDQALFNFNCQKLSVEKIKYFLKLFELKIYSTLVVIFKTILIFDLG